MVIEIKVINISGFFCSVSVKCFIFCRGKQAAVFTPSKWITGCFYVLRFICFVCLLRCKDLLLIAFLDLTVGD